MQEIPAIDIRYLRVDYGNFVAVDDLTLSVPPGEVFGLVGPNGAGKTSTFRVLATLMEPTYGEVILDGVGSGEGGAGGVVPFLPLNELNRPAGAPAAAVNSVGSN